MVNFPSSTKSDFTFAAQTYQPTHTHTQAFIPTQHTLDWFRPTSKNYELKHKSEIFILLKRDSDSFFSSFTRCFCLLFFRLSGAFFFLSLFMFYKNCMWNEKFDLPRESSFQLRSSTWSLRFISVSFRSLFFFIFFASHWGNDYFLSSFFLSGDGKMKQKCMNFLE